MKKKRSVPSAPTPREEFYRRLLGSREEKDLALLAKAHGLAKKTLSWWAWELGRRERARKEASKVGRRPGQRSPRAERPRFLPVRVLSGEEPKPMSPVPATSDPFEVRLRGGHGVSVPQAFDAEGLRRLVAVLEESSC